MKKQVSFLVLLCVFGVVMPARAQVRLGVLGGLNLANLSFEPASDPDPSRSTKLGAGAVVQFRLAENLELQLEPMYLQKGARQESSFDFSFGDAETDSSVTFNADIKAKLSYLELPVMLKLALGTGSTRPYLMAGPTLGWRLSAKYKGTVTVSGFSQEIDEDVKDLTKSMDLGLGFGAGMSFPAGRAAVFVQGRYTLGLTNINDDPEDTATKIKTDGMQVMAGVTFPLGEYK